jgi:Putative zinc- or iron-chelating domain
MSPDEVTQASALLSVEVDDFIKTYSSRVLFKPSNPQVPWVRLQSKQHDTGSACIFLDLDTKHCKIYQARPLQCQAYPFYDELLQSPEAWNEECRRRDDDETSDLPLWTPLTNGCEGMRPVSANDDVTTDDPEKTVPMERALAYYRDFEALERELYKK